MFVTSYYFEWLKKYRAHHLKYLMKILVLNQILLNLEKKNCLVLKNYLWKIHINENKRVQITTL